MMSLLCQKKDAFLYGFFTLDNIIRSYFIGYITLGSDNLLRKIQ